MRTDEIDSEDTIPGLGDIPIIGRLFTKKRTENQRTDLVLTLTPHIIRNTSDLEAISISEGQRYRERLSELPDFMGSREAPETIPGRKEEPESQPLAH